MAKTYTFEFDCTPEHLFEYLIDIDKMLKWMHGVTKIEPIGDGGGDGILAVGSKSNMWIKEGKKEAEYQTEVTVYEPPKRIAVEMTGGCFSGDTAMCPSYELSVSPSGGTRLAYTCEVRTNNVLFKVMGVVFSVFYVRTLNKMMKTLKELAEAPAPA